MPERENAEEFRDGGEGGVILLGQRVGTKCWECEAESVIHRNGAPLIWECAECDGSVNKRRSFIAADCVPLGHVKYEDWTLLY